MRKSTGKYWWWVSGFVVMLAVAFGMRVEASAVNLTFSERSLLALEQRTPLGAQFTGGLILLNAGAQPLQSPDGVSWQQAAPGYTGGSWQLTAEIDAGKMAAYSSSALNWNAGLGRYETTVSIYSSPAGALETTLPVSVSGFGPLAGQLFPGMVTRHNGVLHMTLWQYVTSPETWRGEIVPNARIIASYLVRAAVSTDLQTYQFVSEIASKDTYPASGPFRIHLPLVAAEWLAAEWLAAEWLLPDFLRTASPDQEALPRYYAAEPELISLGPDRLVAAMRTTADDDDAFRPLDPDAVFSSSAASFSDLAGVFHGADAVPGVWSPALDPNLYYSGSQPQPGILVAVSDDSGATWTRQVLGAGGILPQLAYDPGSGILLLAYGGVDYPRRGHALQFSTDQGATWSTPVLLPDADDGFTSGATTLLNTGPNQFLLVYDLLPAYIQVNGIEDFGTYRVVARAVTVVSR